jgi:hypothetical protein
MGKAQFPSSFNWQSTSPETGFLPAPGPNQSVAGNSPMSGVIAGTMSSTNTIYTNILGIRQIDNQGLEINWTGTPTGTIQIMVSNSGIAGNFHALTFNPVLAQPAGSAGGMVIALNNIPFQYMYLQYANATGSGNITAYSQCKANNS